jgi:hypothetical protein
MLACAESGRRMSSRALLRRCHGNRFGETNCTCPLRQLQPHVELHATYGQLDKGTLRQQRHFDA